MNRSVTKQSHYRRAFTQVFVLMPHDGFSRGLRLAFFRSKATMANLLWHRTSFESEKHISLSVRNNGLVLLGPRLQPRQLGILVLWIEFAREL
jgi:hypothetical protein